MVHALEVSANVRSVQVKYLNLFHIIIMRLKFLSHFQLFFICTFQQNSIVTLQECELSLLFKIVSCQGTIFFITQLFFVCSDVDISLFFFHMLLSLYPPIKYLD